MSVVQGWMIVVLLVVIVVLLGVLIGALLARGVPQSLEVVSAPAPGRRRRSVTRARSAKVRAQPKENRPACTADVVDGVVEHFGVARDELVGPSRSPHLVTVRQIAMRLARELTADSYAQIGDALSRDHATVMYGCEQAASMAVFDVRETVMARWELGGIVPSRSEAAR